MIKKRYFKTKDNVEVTFATSVPAEVEGVSLVCDALGWDPEPMKLVGTTWKARVRLPLDRRVHFRYLASGGWWLNDDAADDYEADEHGTVNSVVSTHRP
jgi:hypothetical protein